MRSLLRLLRAVAWLRRRSRVGTYAAFLSVPTVITVAAVWWRLSGRKDRLRLHHCEDDEAARAVVRRMEAVMDYEPTPWLVGGDMHTVVPTLLRHPPSPAPEYRREMMDVCADGRIALDWLGEPEPGSTGGRDVLLILHGLTGGSHEVYVQHMAAEAVRTAGMVAVVMNARGCAGTRLASPQGYCGSWTEDVRATARLARSRAGEGARVFAVGFSLGAGVLSKYLVEEGSEACVDGAAALCASFDFVRSIREMETPLRRVTYNKVLLRALQRYLGGHARDIQGMGNPRGVDFEAVRRASLTRDFDHSVVAPMFGYDGAWDYYHDASTAPFLASRVAVPFLTLSAADDPICDVRGVPTDAPESNPRLFLGVTREGGHVAWATGPRATGKYWYPDACLAFFRAVADGAAPPRDMKIPPRVGRASVGAGVRPGPPTIGIEGDGTRRARVFCE